MTASTPDPRKLLEQAQSVYDDLASDLAILSTDLEAAEGALRIDRRKGGGAKALAARGAQVASLRAIVEDQRVDVAEAAAALERARYAAQRFEAAEIAREAAEGAKQYRIEVMTAARELVDAVVRPAARIHDLTGAWSETFNRYADTIVDFARIAAAEAGAELTDPDHVVLADPQVWESAREQLAAAGIDLAALDVHPHGHQWVAARSFQTGHPPAVALAPLLFSVPPELRVAGWEDLEKPWGLAALNELVGVIADAALTGVLNPQADKSKAAA